MGICTGIATKRVGNGAAAAIGAAFVCLQGLHYLGYIKIDYDRLHRDTTNLFDADGDGKITSADLIPLWNRVKEALTYNLPGAGGFSAGLVLGVWFGR
jgi:uncharacterized membrane protein (Fun14 family)